MRPRRRPRPRFAVLTSRFNEAVTSRLAASCLARLRRGGSSAVESFEVPGAYELPWAAQELARSGRYDAVICLGCILKGATSQNAHIARATIFHLQGVALANRTPCVLGVITPDTPAQARARTRGALDRGREAAEAALELAGLRSRLGRLKRG